MQIHRIFYLMVITLLMAGIRSMAQSESDTARFFTEMSLLQKSLQSAPVSFHVRYTYNSERNPALILDSLSGEMEIAGTGSRYKMAQMETVSTPRYNIVLFKEDKLMYLSSPSNIPGNDPLQQLRAMVAVTGIQSCRVTEEGHIRTIAVRFVDGAPCREMSMHIDRRTGYMMNATYVLKTALLMGPEQEANSAVVAEYGEYAVVRVAFSRYQKLNGDPERFDERNYFSRKGDVFEPAPAYADYTIFKGSPNL